jgi:hypothetical protein
VSLTVDGDETLTYEMTSISFPESDPGFITGYYYAYDEEGLVLEGAEIYLKIHSAVDNGNSYSQTVRVAESDSEGQVMFTNLVPGASYQLRRGGSGRWNLFTIPLTATSPYGLDDLIGED